MYFDEILDHFKFGKKIRRASWPTGVTISRNFDSINIKDLLADDWEVVAEKNKWWEPKKDEKYYIIYGDGSIDYINYDGDYGDKRLMAIGNCFQTEEQAEFMAEKLTVIHELEKFAFENNEEEINWSEYSQRKYTIVFDHKSHDLGLDVWSVNQDSPFNVYFTSKALAKKAIETIGEDRIKKYYFGVEENGRK